MQHRPTRVRDVETKTYPDRAHVDTAERASASELMLFTAVPAHSDDNAFQMKKHALLDTCHVICEVPAAHFMLFISATTRFIRLVPAIKGSKGLRGSRPRSRHHGPWIWAFASAKGPESPICCAGFRCVRAV